MQKDTAKKAFDTADRDRMRAALIRYMQEHRIGAPTLQARIAQASGRGTDLIPLKTLQRFLAHSHRTNDAFLIPVHQFSSTLPVPDESAAFARALGGFFRDAKEETGGGGFAGSFAVYAGERRVTPGILKEKEGRFRVRQANLTARAEAQGGVAAVVEEVLLGDEGKPAHQDSDFRHRYEGIAIDKDKPIIALLRNVLTGFPKSYWLYPDEGEDFYGFVSARGFNDPEKGEPQPVVVEAVSQDDLTGREAQRA